jgi:glycosyltransferase involved in cell wall biosynthesis
MRIAIFSDSFYPDINGVANTVLESAQNLSDAGHSVLVCAPSSCTKEQLKNRFGEKFEVLKVPSMPFFGYSDVRMAFPNGKAFFRFVKNKFRPDIIHSHTFFGVGWEAVAHAKLLKIPLIGTHHTFYDHYLKHVKLDYSWAKKLSWRVTVAYYNLCDSIISPSRALGKELNSRGLKKNIEFIPNSINELFFKPMPSAGEKKELARKLGLNRPVVVYMGRVSYEKNIDQVLKAFAIFSKRIPEAILMIIGDGPEKKNLEELAKRLCIESKTKFTGFLNGQELLKAMQASDIFVTASKSENMPLSVLEAMAAGLPVVAAAEKGLPEIVKDGVNGFLVEADRPDLMAHKLYKLASQPKLMLKFGMASQTEARQYSKEAVTQKLVNSYNQLIKTI